MLPELLHFECVQRRMPHALQQQPTVVVPKLQTLKGPSSCGIGLQCARVAQESCVDAASNIPARHIQQPGLLKEIWIRA